MVDVYDVRRRCAQATAIADAAAQALQPPPRHHTDLKSYNHHPQHHGKGQRYPPATATAPSTTATAYSNNTATPLRADNTFLKMTNATSSYPLYIKNVPYATASRLQTLDICLPRPLSESPADAVWVVYIHGGAWRDPLVTSASIYPALTQLLSSSTPSSHGTTRPLTHIAGFASINYRLSPYPQHPTCPSLSPTTSIPARHEGRNATHPTHVHDVATALRWLRAEYGVGGRGAALPTRDYVVVGHSCGATLACQLLDGWLADEDPAAMEAPVGVAGLCGIYNLPLLAENHAGVPAYEEFLQAAFGGDESVWLRASPTQLGDAYAHPPSLTLFERLPE
ncbi:putative alpha beta hydrolase fold-3 protein [Neofusicoccum parvum UCRNP2]|uniref:Putative alpha beta hydrolase fold-3 protein n=1 Tax=Botryosphaeria parva (strain UCR-NP2) TaxID=1287680 RepID=R1GJD1_BOTPV|nr:putative alpha beta hydrolase fold-3 protein [Neofusicoccum parvum UCRNP2]